MKHAKLLSTVAATLLITVGAVAAQDVKKEAPTPAPAAQKAAPAEKIAPAMKPGEQKADAPKAPETIGQAPKASEPDKGQMKTQATDKAGPAAADKAAQPAAAPKADTKADAKGSMNTQPKAKDSAAEGAASPKSSQTAAPEQKGATTGQGAAGASVKLSTEQRTKITTIIKQQKVERLEPSKLNISISVGTRIPASVRFYPLPQEVFVIYPEWRGYDYILVGNEILVVDPRTHEIVAILEA